MRNLVLLVVALALVFSAVLLAASPVLAMSDQGGCRAANGGVHGQDLAQYAQDYQGIRRGPDACGSLVPPA